MELNQRIKLAAKPNCDPLRFRGRFATVTEIKPNSISVTLDSGKLVTYRRDLLIGD